MLTIPKLSTILIILITANRSHDLLEFDEFEFNFNLLNRDDWDQYDIKHDYSTQNIETNLRQNSKIKFENPFELNEQNQNTLRRLTTENNDLDNSLSSIFSPNNHDYTLKCTSTLPVIFKQLCVHWNFHHGFKYFYSNPHPQNTKLRQTNWFYHNDNHESKYAARAADSYYSDRLTSTDDNWLIDDKNWAEINYANSLSSFTLNNDESIGHYMNNFVKGSFKQCRYQTRIQECAHFHLPSKTLTLRIKIAKGRHRRNNAIKSPANLLIANQQHQTYMIGNNQKNGNKNRRRTLGDQDNDNDEDGYHVHHHHHFEEIQDEAPAYDAFIPFEYGDAMGYHHWANEMMKWKGFDCLNCEHENEPKLKQQDDLDLRRFSNNNRRLMDIDIEDVVNEEEDDIQEIDRIFDTEYDAYGDYTYSFHDHSLDFNNDNDWHGIFMDGDMKCSISIPGFEHKLCVDTSDARKDNHHNIKISFAKSSDKDVDYGYYDMYGYDLYYYNIDHLYPHHKHNHNHNNANMEYYDIDSDDMDDDDDDNDDSDDYDSFNSNYYNNYLNDNEYTHYENDDYDDFFHYNSDQFANDRQRIQTFEHAKNAISKLLDYKDYDNNDDVFDDRGKDYTDDDNDDDKDDAKQSSNRHNHVEQETDGINWWNSDNGPNGAYQNYDNSNPFENKGVLQMGNGLKHDYNTYGKYDAWKTFKRYHQPISQPLGPYRRRRRNLMEDAMYDIEDSEHYEEMYDNVQNQIDAWNNEFINTLHNELGAVSLDFNDNDLWDDITNINSGEDHLKSIRKCNTFQTAQLCVTRPIPFNKNNIKLNLKIGKHKFHRAYLPWQIDEEDQQEQQDELKQYSGKQEDINNYYYQYDDDKDDKHMTAGDIEHMLELQNGKINEDGTVNEDDDDTVLWNIDKKVLDLQYVEWDDNTQWDDITEIPTTNRLKQPITRKCHRSYCLCKYTNQVSIHECMSSNQDKLSPHHKYSDGILDTFLSASRANIRFLGKSARNIPKRIMMNMHLHYRPKIIHYHIINALKGNPVFHRRHHMHRYRIPWFRYYRFKHLRPIKRPEWCPRWMWREMNKHMKQTDVKPITRGKMKRLSQETSTVATAHIEEDDRFMIDDDIFNEYDYYIYDANLADQIDDDNFDIDEVDDELPFLAALAPMLGKVLPKLMPMAKGLLGKVMPMAQGLMGKMMPMAKGLMGQAMPMMQNIMGGFMGQGGSGMPGMIGQMFGSQFNPMMGGRIPGMSARGNSLLGGFGNAYAQQRGTPTQPVDPRVQMMLQQRQQQQQMMPQPQPQMMPRMRRRMEDNDKIEASNIIDSWYDNDNNMNWVILRNEFNDNDLVNNNINYYDDNEWDKIDQNIISLSGNSIKRKCMNIFGKQLCLCEFLDLLNKKHHLCYPQNKQKQQKTPKTPKKTKKKPVKVSPKPSPKTQTPLLHRLINGKPIGEHTERKIIEANKENKKKQIEIKKEKQKHKIQKSQQNKIILKAEANIIRSDAKILRSNVIQHLPGKRPKWLPHYFWHWLHHYPHFHIARHKHRVSWVPSSAVVTKQDDIVSLSNANMIKQQDNYYDDGDYGYYDADNVAKDDAVMIQYIDNDNDDIDIDVDNDNDVGDGEISFNNYYDRNAAPNSWQFENVDNDDQDVDDGNNDDIRDNALLDYDNEYIDGDYMYFGNFLENGNDFFPGLDQFEEKGSVFVTILSVIFIIALIIFIACCFIFVMKRKQKKAIPKLPEQQYLQQAFEMTASSDEDE